MSNRSSGRVIYAALKFCGSIPQGIALMTILAIVMGWATFLEREMGTPAAQYLVYASPWFYFLVALLAFNLACSAIARLPKLFPVVDGRLRYNRALAPFFLAHLGVILLVLGCLVTALKSSKARATVAEGTAVEKAIDGDSHLLRVQLLKFDFTAAADGPAREPNATDIEIPFSGGPINWRDQQSAKLWRADVAEPVLAAKPEKKFFNRLGKKASAISQRCAYLASRLGNRSRAGVLYDADGLKIEALEYATCADYAPVPDLLADLVVRKPDGVDETKRFSLTFPFEGATIGGDPLATTRKSQRATLDDGIRVVYMIADSCAEANAFTQVVPQSETADCAVLMLDGRRFELALEDLGLLSQYGDLENQFESLKTQRDEIRRRLDQEREYVENAVVPEQEPAPEETPEQEPAATDLPVDESATEEGTDAEPASDEPEAAISVVSERYAQEAESQEGSKASKLKPLQTVSRDDLNDMGTKLRELSDNLAQLADAATDPSGAPNEGLEEYKAALREFNRQRTLNYLATTWTQLESVTPTSEGLIETLEKMLSETSRRADEVEKLAQKTKLGDSGWRVLSFGATPTQVQGVEDLQGWTGAFTLESPQGEAVELTLFSELPERNRYPESGRVYGALWLASPGGDDNQYGRRWNANLGMPRLEIMQSSEGVLSYRYSVPGVYASGTLNASPLDEVQDTRKADTVNIAPSPSASGADQIVSFTLNAFALQDELGARLTPTLFVKDSANEFYGKLKLRVTLDETTETFWLRTIPLESVEKSQIPLLTRTVVSKTRRAKINLTDREIDLGVALYVRKFTPVYEPGSSTPASFASLTRLLPQGLTPEEQARAITENPEDDALIQMNRPGVLKAPGSPKVFWAYQDSFRGPYKPGDKQFDDVVQGKLLPGENAPRDSIYYTIISLNDDPGRGLKYLACLFVVWGTALLIYRGRAPKERRREESEPEGTSSASTPSGSASTLLLTALCVVAGALAAFAGRAARADEIDPSTEKRVEIAREVHARNDIDWTPWRLLPVFDGGRRMPLNTFAQIMVHDVTGANSPVVNVPPSVLDRLEGDKPLNFPDLEEFLNDVNAGEDAQARRKEQEEWYADVAAKTVARQKDVANRVRAAFPDGKRKFAAAELLFSWLAEPELWESVPFVLDEKGLVAREVFKFPESEIAARGERLAPADFDALKRGTDKTLVESYRAAPSADPDVLKALDKAEDRLAQWRSVTFVPTQGASSRPRACLNKALYGAMPAAMTATHGMQTSPMTKLDDASRRIERLLSHEKRALRKTSPLFDKEHLLRQRTKLANDESRDTLTLARQTAILAEIYRRYPLSSTGVLFDKLLNATSRALDELRAHRDAIMSEQTFSLEYRQALEEAVSALDEIVGCLERASLALTTEEPKSLCVAPVVRERVFRVSESQDAPWVSLQTLLWSPDPIYARFVDPEEADKILERDSLPEDQETISPFDDMLSALHKTLANQSTSRPEVNAFVAAIEAYRDRDADDRGARVTEALASFAEQMQSLAERGEKSRRALAEKAAADSETIDAYLAKTAYLKNGALDAELFYYDLNAFYWNWVACLCAVIAFLVSYLRQGLGRLPGGERFFFTLGLLSLVAGCFVAFLGGATRAYITGWAPVANMFETVVLLAFLIAAIAIFYTLAPFWGRPYLNAWRATAFPTRDMAPEVRKISLVMSPIRALLMLALIYGGVSLWLQSRKVAGAALDAICRQVVDSLSTQGILDALAVLATFFFVVWLVPRFLVALLAIVCFPGTTCRRDDVVVIEGRSLRQELIAQVVERRAFLTASAIVAALVAAAAYFNSVEFNPNIKPLVAVLRSNFWLTIHVLAIIVSYALGAIAWVVSLVSLAHYIFGRYQNDPESGKFDPEYSDRVSPAIATMLRSAVLFLTAGIVLGARWADFSWGRFWSWDPKEVWALVTLLVYLVVLHARRLSGRNRFVLSLGATLGALAIIMTWYGLSFVMGGGGRHSYAAGESNKVAALYILFAANVAWAIAAIARYSFEKARRKARGGVSNGAPCGAGSAKARG